MIPDDVCVRFVEAGLKIKVWEEDNMVFIEGTREALEAIGELFKAQANFVKRPAAAKLVDQALL